MKIKLVLKEGDKIEKSLMFVKIIKDYTGMGLKDSKDILDEIKEKKASTIELNDVNVIRSLKNKLHIENISVSVLWKEYERSKKLIKLELANEDSCREFLSEMLVSSVEKNSDIIEYSLSIMNKEQLKKIFDKYESYI